jgi:hypothetical protein
VSFEKTVFINCPFDEEYSPLLEAAIFCCVILGFEPLLATLRLESGENRLDKITGLLKSAKYSIHDLSRNKSSIDNEVFRMNMPFEFGIDFGLRQSGNKKFGSKKFLVFEAKRFELKAALSDIAGQDVEFHNGKYEEIIRHIRNFFHVEAGVEAPGPTAIKAKYENYQAWVTDKKIQEGHSEAEALNLPFKERITEIYHWIDSGSPDEF